MQNIVICGDSFSIGIGCNDLYVEPFGSLLSKKLDRNPVTNEYIIKIILNSD